MPKPYISVQDILNKCYDPETGTIRVSTVADASALAEILARLDQIEARLTETEPKTEEAPQSRS